MNAAYEREIGVKPKPKLTLAELAAKEVAFAASRKKDRRTVGYIRRGGKTMPIRKYVVSEGAVHLVKDDPLPLVTKGNDLGEGQGGAVGGHHVVGYTGEDGVRRADTCDAEGYVVATYVGKHCEVFAQAAADALDRAAMHEGEIEKAKRTTEWYLFKGSGGWYVGKFTRVEGGQPEQDSFGPFDSKEEARYELQARSYKRQKQPAKDRQVVRYITRGGKRIPIRKSDGFEKRLPRLGSGERHRRLVARLRERGDVKDPEAVASAIGRAKWGKGRYQRLAAKGRKRAARSK